MYYYVTITRLHVNTPGIIYCPHKFSIFLITKKSLASESSLKILLLYCCEWALNSFWYLPPKNEINTEPTLLVCHQTQTAIKVYATLSLFNREILGPPFWLAFQFWVSWIVQLCLILFHLHCPRLTSQMLVGLTFMSLILCIRVALWVLCFLCFGFNCLQWLAD